MCWAHSSALRVRVSFSLRAGTPTEVRKALVRSTKDLASAGMQPAAASASSTIASTAPADRLRTRRRAGTTMEVMTTPLGAAVLRGGVGGAEGDLYNVDEF